MRLHPVADENLLEGTWNMVVTHESAQRIILHELLHIALQEFVAAQEQFGEVDHALALALRFVFAVQLDAARGVVVVGLGLRGANALLLVRVDEVGEFARREFLVVDVEVFQEALDRRQLHFGHDHCG